MCRSIIMTHKQDFWIQRKLIDFISVPHPLC
nr:MAG TPA: hypothetical protein [Caudoviricetes sp.]